MRTGHFSSEKQTDAEIRDPRGRGEGGQRIDSQFRIAYLRVAPRETIRIISIPRT